MVTHFFLVRFFEKFIQNFLLCFITYNTNFSTSWIFIFHHVFVMTIWFLQKRYESIPKTLMKLYSYKYLLGIIINWKSIGLVYSSSDCGNYSEIQKYSWILQWGHSCFHSVGRGKNSQNLSQLYNVRHYQCFHGLSPRMQICKLMTLLRPFPYCNEDPGLL